MITFVRSGDHDGPIHAITFGRMMRIGQLHECLWRTLKRAGLRDVRWHDLRHSFASHLAAAGVPLNVVQARMGHSTILMTMRYAHLAPDQHRTFVDLGDWAKNGQKHRSRGVAHREAP